MAATATYHFLLGRQAGCPHHPAHRGTPCDKPHKEWRSTFGGRQPAHALTRPGIQNPDRASCGLTG